MEIWPNFFIVGAPKAGTTSLYEYLKNVPGIFMPSLKEPHYFSEVIIPEHHPYVHPIRDKKKYLSLFEKAKNYKIIGEASPSYLTDPKAPKLIHQISPNAKIVISLRDPVNRLFSQYLMRLRLGRDKATFHKELELELKNGTDYSKPNLGLETGLYSEKVKRYLNIFGKNQVKILIFEEWIKNPKNTVNEIIKFLGLNHRIQNFKEEVFNPYGVSRNRFSKFVFNSPRIKKISRDIFSQSFRKLLREKLLVKHSSKPKMDQNDRKNLVKFYRNDVLKLQILLGQQLPWTNFDNS